MPVGKIVISFEIDIEVVGKVAGSGKNTDELGVGSI